MKLIRILLFVFAFPLNTVAEKEIIYLAPNGQDSNPGTMDKPLASLTGARDLIRKLPARDTVYVNILSGDYFMKAPLELTSQDDKAIIFEGIGDNVTFYGAVPVTNWEKVNDRLWRASISGTKGNLTFEQFYVNGKRASRARTPNRGFFQVEAVTERILHEGKGRIPEFAIQKIHLHPEDVSLLQMEDPDNIKNALITFYHKWDVTRKYIDHFDADSSAVYTRGKGMQPWNRINGISKYYIENIPSALDAPGEWLLKNDGYVYYIPREGEQLASVSAFAPVSEKFIIIKGNEGHPVKNKTFRNIHFKVTAHQTSKQGNDPMQAAAPVEASIMVDHADHIVFENCELAHTGLYGIWFRRQVSNSKINTCYLHDLGAGGVKIGDFLYYEEDEDVTANNLVHNSIIRDGGHLFPSAVGVIVFHSRDNEITHNEIADFKYSGVSVGWMWGYEASKVVTTIPDKFGNLQWKEGYFASPATGNEIAYNHIHHLGWGELSDMGGVYIVSEAKKTQVHHNKIHHIYSDTYGGWGLYTDEGATHVTMEKNLVYACKNSGFHQHYGKENIIRNNIFAFNLKGQVQFTRVEKHQSFEFTNNIIYTNSGEMLLGNLKEADVKMENNCYWDTRTNEPLFLDMHFSEWKKLKDSNSVLADPGFADAENFDFRLKSKAVARKIGFEPFDYEKAGVYGSEEWKELAKLDSSRITLFRNLVNEKEK
ncbi:MAG: right-handed parallel beta-helix repeat-containing protein [Cyclobacteriaceae bacterium]